MQNRALLGCHSCTYNASALKVWNQSLSEVVDIEHANVSGVDCLCLLQVEASPPDDDFLLALKNAKDLRREKAVSAYAGMDASEDGFSLP